MVRTFKFAILILLAVTANLGCTRKTGGSSVKITAPKFTGSQKITFAQYGPGTAQKSVSSMTDSTSSFNPLLNPLQLSEFNCFGVFVGGQGFSGGGTCSVSDGTAFTFGDFAGGVAGGGTMELSVPSGNRQITLMGFKAETAAACGNFKAGMPMAQLSEPFVVARATVDLPAGEATVSLTPDSFTSKITNCQFASDSGGNYFFYGTGSDGDYSAGTSFVTLSSATNGLSQFFMSASRVTSISNNNNGTATITVSDNWNSSTESHVKAGDEIMLYAAGGDPGTPGGCNEIWPGFSESGLVTLAFTGAVVGKSFRMMIRDSRWLSIPAANLTASASGAWQPTSFCRVIAVRVPHFNNFTVTNTSVTLNTSGSPQPLEMTASDHVGLGLMPIRIKGILSVPSGKNLDLNVNGSGYKGGDGTGARGHGQMGRITGTGVASSHGMAGGYDGGGFGCGGGHGGLGGCPTNGSNGQIEGDEWGCNIYDGTRSCLKGKFFMGGGGGANTATGGAGGGALRIFAKQLVLDGYLTLFANGQAGTSGGDAGGAGGSIFLVSDSISGAGSFSFYAIGGDGTSAGVGGGGRVHAIFKSATFSGTATGSAAAAGSGNTANSSNGTCRIEGVTVSGCP